MENHMCRLKVAACIVVGLALIVSNASAQAPAPSAAMTSLCTQDQSTGFRWENNRWVLSRFITERFSIRKLSFEEVETIKAKKIVSLASIHCTPRQGSDLGTSGFHFGCYEFTDLSGEKPLVLSAGLCKEYWRDGKHQFVSCRDFFPAVDFVPDGQFQESKMPPQLDIAPERDSIYIAHGQCKVIK